MALKILWLATSSMQLQPIITSLEYTMKVLFASVSSMMQETIHTGIELAVGQPVTLCKFDKGKEEQHHYEGEVDQVILTAFDNLRPDVVIYSGPAEGRCRPLLTTFLTMRESAKVVKICCDGGCPNWHPLLETYTRENCFDLVVNIDGNPRWPSRPEDLTMWAPIDPRYYEKPALRTVDFGFAGGLGSLSRRQITDRLIRDCKLVIPPRSEQWGTYQDYADFMLSCRSVFNMSRTGSGKTHHMKYRVMEAALAGCVLYEEMNDITPLYFEPDVDYIEYETIDDLVDLLGREELVEAFIYGQGPRRVRDKALTKYGARVFWSRVFAALGKPITAEPL